MNKEYYERKGIDSIEQITPITSSSKSIIKEAKKLGINVEIIPYTNIFKLEHKGETKFYHQQIPTETTSLAYEICENKQTCKNVLSYAGIQTPKGLLILRVDSPEYIKQVYDHLSKPLVVKPLRGSKGNCVLVGINTKNKYLKSVNKIFNESKEVIVEEMFVGKEYRILATQEKVIGIINRIPANIIGDGKSTIHELVRIKNLDPRRGHFDAHMPLFKIVIDKEVEDYLEEQNLELNNVPKKNERIFLRKVSNISMGGDSIDCTDIAHKSVENIAIKCINAIPGLKLGGVDFITKDITKLQTEESYRIIEVNASSHLGIHYSPMEGSPRETFFEFLQLIFPSLTKQI